MINDRSFKACRKQAGCVPPLAERSLVPDQRAVLTPACEGPVDRASTRVDADLTSDQPAWQPPPAPNIASDGLGVA